MKKKFLAILICLGLTVTLLPCVVYAGAELLSVKSSGDNVVATYSGSTSLSNIIFLAEFDENGNLENITATNASKNAELSLPYKTGKTYKTFALKKSNIRPLSESEGYAGIDFDGEAAVPMVDGSVASATTLAIREYADARLKIDELLELDISDVYGDTAKYNEYMAKINEAKAAYDEVLKTAAVLDRASASSASRGEAQLQSMQQEAKLFATEDEQLHWAQQITQQYDSIKGTKKLGELGKMLGCDAKEAYQQLVAAQDVLRGKYLSDANTADNWVKGLTIVKTGCKVTLAAGGVGAAAAAGGATLLGAIGICVSGVDATIDIGRTTAVVTFGDDSKIVKRYEDAFEPITTATMIFSVLTLNSASAGEKIACLGDVKQYIHDKVQDKTGYDLDELTFKLSGGQLIADILSTKYTKEDFIEYLKDPAFIGNDRYERIKKRFEDYEDNREGDTTPKLEEILKEEELIEENETIEDFEDEIKEFDKESKEELATKMSEEEDGTGGGGGGGGGGGTGGGGGGGTGGGGGGSTGTINYLEEESGNHLYKYYKNNKTNCKIGLYEDYMYDHAKGDYVLVHQEFYDDNGNIQSIKWFSLDGRISSLSTYTDGYNVGSIITHVFYYTEEDHVEIPEGAIDPVRYSNQEIIIPYVDPETGEEDTTTKPYFGEYFSYSPSGELWEHSTGVNGEWAKTEVYDGSGAVTIDYVNNFNGTYTENSYFTKKTDPYIPFNPAGHKQYSQVKLNGEYTWTNGVPLSNDFVSADEWRLESWSESAGKNSYYAVYGYLHMYNRVDHYHDGDYAYASPHTGLYYASGERVEAMRTGPHTYE